MVWRSRDDSQTPSPLVQSTKGNSVPGSWTPDGKTLVYYVVNTQIDWDIWTLPEDGAPEPFLASTFNERAPRLSPNGEWVAYVSDQANEDRIYVRALREGGEVFPISTGPGVEAVWSRDGRELFYRNGDQLWVVDVETEPGFRAGSPSMLFEAPYIHGNDGANPNYDVSLDGQHFLMVQQSGSVDETPVIVVQNWHEELKRLVPVD